MGGSYGICPPALRQALPLDGEAVARRPTAPFMGAIPLYRARCAEGTDSGRFSLFYPVACVSMGVYRIIVYVGIANLEYF